MQFVPGQAFVTLFAIVILLTCESSVPAAPRLYPDGAIKAVKKLGGLVHIDELHPDRPVIAVDLNHAKLDKDSLKPLQEFDELQSLDLSWADLAKADLSYLDNLKKLRKLDLSYSLAREGLSHIKVCSELRELDLTCTCYSEEDLKSIAEGCKMLTRLTLNHTVSENLIKTLSRLRHLRTLIIGDLTDEGLQILARMPSLRKLLWNYQATNETSRQFD